MLVGLLHQCVSVCGGQLAEQEPVRASPNVYGLQLVQGLLAFAPVELAPAPLEPAPALFGPGSATLEPAPAPLELAPTPLELAPGDSELGEAHLGLELAFIVALECSRVGD